MASQVALVVKNSPANAEEVRALGLIPGLGSSPGGGNGNPFQYPCLENPMDRGSGRATVHEAAKSQTWQSTQVKACTCRRMQAHKHTLPEEFKFCFHSKDGFFKTMCKRESRKTRYLFLQIQINFKKFLFDYLWHKNLLRHLLNLVGEVLPILSLKQVFSVKIMDEFSLKATIYLN